VDGDTTALDATTDNLVGSLAVDDRVRVHLHSDGIIVTGVQGGGGDGGGNGPNPNLLINGNFRTNQREYTSGAAIAGLAYSFDRWKTFAGATLTFTTAPQGQPVTISSDDSIKQIIERASVPTGSYVLSWEGTASARVYNTGSTPPSLSSSPVVFTADGLADVNVEFLASGAGTKTLSKVQFEAGTVPTPFALGSVADELAECQRYYQRRGAGGGNVHISFGWAPTTTDVRFELDLPVQMRAAPTLTSAATLNFYQGTGSGMAVTSLILAGPDLSHIGMRGVVSGASAGVPGYLFSASSGSYIAFDAEL